MQVNRRVPRQFVARLQAALFVGEFHPCPTCRQRIPKVNIKIRYLHAYLRISVSNNNNENDAITCCHFFPSKTNLVAVLCPLFPFLMILYFALVTWADWKQQSSLLLVMQPTLLRVVPEVRPEDVAAFWSHGM
jgi:hypothetical protein